MILCEALKKGKNNLEELDVGNNTIEVDGALKIAELLEEKKSFIKLVVRTGGIEPEGVEGLLNAVAKNLKMEILDLAESEFNEENIGHLEIAIKNCTKLVVLDLTDTGTQRSAEAIFTIIRDYGRVLTDFYYNNNELKDGVGRRCLDLALNFRKLKLLEMRGTISGSLGKEYVANFSGKGIALEYEKIKSNQK